MRPFELTFIIHLNGTIYRFSELRGNIQLRKMAERIAVTSSSCLTARSSCLRVALWSPTGSRSGVEEQDPAPPCGTGVPSAPTSSSGDTVLDISGPHFTLQGPSGVRHVIVWRKIWQASAAHLCPQPCQCHVSFHALWHTMKSESNKHMFRVVCEEHPEQHKKQFLGVWVWFTRFWDSVPPQQHVSYKRWPEAEIARRQVRTTPNWNNGHFAPDDPSAAICNYLLRASPTHSQGNRSVTKNRHWQQLGFFIGVEFSYLLTFCYYGECTKTLPTVEALNKPHSLCFARSVNLYQLLTIDMRKRTTYRKQEW